MGADIHIMLERKLKSGGWAVVDKFNSIRSSQLRNYDGPEFTYSGRWPGARNYNLFALLAGVRGQGPEPKGLPPDVSDLAAEDLSGDDQDLHSHSWVTARDFVIATWRVTLEDKAFADLVATKLTDPNWFEDRMVAYFEERVSTEYVTPNYCADENEWTLDDYRFVFAFDN